MAAILVALAIFFVPLSVIDASGAAVMDVYADVNHTACELFDNAQPPVVFVYYFLRGASEATAVRFAAVKPACWTGATFAGDSSPYVVVGNTQTDYSVAFGACLHGTVYVAKTAYLVTGTGTPCCKVSAHISMDGNLQYADCSFALLPLATGTSVTINPNQTCPCQSPVTTERSTWGRVKSLYR